MKTAKLKFAFKPYELQQEIIDYIDGKYLNSKGKPYRFFVAALGRQVGKSWLAKLLALDHAGNRDETVMWVAPTIPTARGHWNDLIKLIRDAQLVENGVVTKISQNAKEIHFRDGGVIYIRTAIEPDNLRGASLDLLILDEAAFFRNGNYVWYSVCLPMITATGGKVVITTTPNGRNWVYSLFKRGYKTDEIIRQDMGDGTYKELNRDDDYYVSWNFNSYVSPYQDVELLDELRTTMPSVQWREEFLAEFIPDGGGVFAGVERAAISPFLSEPEEHHTYVMGIDVGFNNDYTCITVIDTITRQQVWGIRFTGIGTIQAIKKIIAALEKWQPEKVVIEKNGVGEYFVDMLRTITSGGDIDDILSIIEDAEENTDEFFDSIENVGEYAIVAIHMDNAKKRQLVERLAADIEFGRFKILVEEDSYGEIQINEMSTYERKPTSSGMGITYQASDENDHDDTVAALYLAYSGVKPYSRTRSLSKRNKRNPFRSKVGGGNLGSFRRSKYHA